MLSNVPGLGRTVSLSKIQQIPLLSAPLGGGLISLRLVIIVIVSGLELQKAGNIVIDDDTIVIVFDRVLETEIILILYQIDSIFLMLFDGHLFFG